MQKITPFLWFNDNGEQAVNFYVSIFKNGKIVNTRRHEDGKLFFATFQIEGQDFMVLNGGPKFTFTEAISLFVNCDSQQEIDDL